MASIDKILTVANNYYNAKVSEEGRGRFPGHSKYDSKVGGFDLPDGANTDEALETYLEDVLVGISGYTSDLSDFVYVFSPSIDDEDAIQGNWMSFDNDGVHQVSVGFDEDGALAFKENFGNNGISSPFQEGGYIYLVIPGSGSGTTAKAPALLVADIENPIQMHKTLTP